MRATCWTGTTSVEVQDVPDPKILNPRDAIVRVSSTAICGSDLHLYDGYMPTMEKGDILGHEFMGEVVEGGIGDKVVVGRSTLGHPRGRGRARGGLDGGDGLGHERRPHPSAIPLDGAPPLEDAVSPGDHHGPNVTDVPPATARQQAEADALVTATKLALTVADYGDVRNAEAAGYRAVQPRPHAWSTT
jgi:NADPH:quinone reductase-like Zn-dependent oxidoreductase